MQLGNLEGCEQDSDHLQMTRNILQLSIPTNILDSQMERLGKGVWSFSHEGKKI